MAQPVRDLARSTIYYRDLLGLRVQGGFHDHDGYDGVFFALPGGGQLELTTGPTEPRPGTPEDLLILYVGTIAEVRTIGSGLVTAGVVTVPSENPYWNRLGQTFLDPDGYRIVIAQGAPEDAPIEQTVDQHSPAEIKIEWHIGPRAELRSLFELAEDSQSQLNHYLDDGRVLIAVRGSVILGHLQLVPSAEPGEVELKNMGVLPVERGTGLGRALVAAAIRSCPERGWSRMVVSTAAASTGTLRFYQRVGFRMLSVERDAFTSATGYSAPVVIDGIQLLDRVWLSQDLSKGRSDPLDRDQWKDAASPLYTP